MKRILSFLIILLVACTSKKEERIDIQRKTIQQLPIFETYISSLKEKNKLKAISEKKTIFFRYLVEDMPVYWCGTKWDFNGVTRTPKKGEIACGYFVTTLLEDFGFEIKRIYLAQQASSVMINQLCAKKSIKHFSKVEQLEVFMLNRSEQEIYIVGLDFHTGFLIRKGEKMYFFHSNYINKSGVVFEEIKKSDALKNSQSFMIGSLSENTSLFK